MSLFGFTRRLLGYYVVRIAPGGAERVINAVLRRGTDHGEFVREPDGSLTFKIARKDLPELREIIDKSGFLEYSLYGKGLPFLLRRYRRRYGFAAGALIFLAIAYISTRFIWRVEVTSHTSLNKNAVERNLAAVGVRPGAYIPDCDFWDLSMRYLTAYDDCSWLSVNMSGTVAEVELRERVPTPDAPDGSPCNIVAAEGGVIDTFVIHSGRGYVTSGDVVKKGDLLVSGVIEDTQGGFRLKSADAEVYAEVERVISASVPLEYTGREYTGAEKSASSLGFFGLSFSVPFGDSDPGDGWECADDTSAITLPDGKTLPVSHTRTVWREYADVKKSRTEDEALAIAKRDLERQISRIAAEARILEITRSVAADDGSVTAAARVRCICDVAEKREIIHTDTNG